MISGKLQKRIEKLSSESGNEIRITKRYIDPEDTIFDVATYISHNIQNSFFVIECEMKYTTDNSSDVFKYSFEVQRVNDNIITDFNMKQELKQKMKNIMTDIGYTNNIMIENQIQTITIQR